MGRASLHGLGTGPSTGSGRAPGRARERHGRLGAGFRRPAGVAPAPSSPAPPPSGFRLARLARARRAAACALAAAFVLLLAAGPARAQTAVCSSTPGEGERVECVRDATNQAPIEIELDGVDIQTTDDTKAGVFLYKQSQQSTGDIDLSIVGSSIGNTASSTEHLVSIRHEGSGDIRIVIRDSSFTNLADNHNLLNVWTVTPFATGAIDLLVEGSRFSTAGGNNIFVDQSHPGDVRIRVRDSTFTGTDDYGSGIFAVSGRGGVIDVAVSGGSISTEGDAAGGIVAAKYGTGQYASADPIKVEVDGTTIRTAGGLVAGFTEARHQKRSRTRFGSPGIAAEHRGSGSVSISVRGGSIIVSGLDQHGIAVGGLSVDRTVLYATSGRDEDGYRRQTVRVDGPVQGGTGTGAGVALYGGGRVFIGPDGRVGALSGTAIRAAVSTSHVAGHMTNDENPKLYVELRPGGRRVSDLLAGAIVNEGGASYTTVAVNGVVLMDGGTVAEGVLAPNGARDVWLRAGTDGANIAVADFLDRYAPRAAVYEALPGFLLRLDEAGGGVEFRAPESPFWLRVSGGAGSYRPESASTGARYRHTRYGVEAGVDSPLDDGFAGWAGVRAVSGSARVSAATGGGRIEASGFGLAGGLSWENADGFYGTGRVSLTRYGVDYSSSARGRLASGASALVHALDLEGGRRFALDGETVVAPWARLGYSGASMDGVTDAVGSRIAVADSDRRTLGVGADAEIELDPGSGEERLALRGSFGLERPLGGGTAVRVFDEELVSKAPGGVRVLLGVGAVWETGPFTLEGRLSANGLGSDDRDFTGSIGLRAAF